MVKILYLDHAPYEGGAEVSLKELLKNLPRDKYEVILVAPTQASYVQDLAETDIIKVVDFNFHWRIYKFIFPLIWDLFGLIQIIRREKPQVIHTNTRVTNILAGFLRIPCILYPVSCIFINHIRDRDPLPGWKFKLISAADLLIANSQKTKDFLVEGGVCEEKIQVIYNGVDLTKFDPEQVKGRIKILKEELKIKKDELVLTTIGQIYPRKGHEYLLKAFAQVVSEIPKVRLLVVGQDPTDDQRYCHKLYSYIKDLNLNDKVNLLGYRKDIPEILALTDLFVLPSLEEPFGRVLIEAMVMEKPVVATDVGGIPEIVEDGKSGGLVPPAHPEKLSAAILRLLADRNLRVDFGKRGRKIVEEKFDLQVHVEQVQRLYDEAF